MELSDEDQKAIATVRQAMMDWIGPDSDPGFVESLERVLFLAGEIPPEPDDQTFWYDAQDRIVYQRDDLQNPGFDGNWYATGRMAGETWASIGPARRRLVQLVPKSSKEWEVIPGTAYQEVLMELLGAWEAQHREKCGGSVRLSRCKYADCMGYWQRLHNLGVPTTWESVGS